MELLLTGGKGQKAQLLLYDPYSNWDDDHVHKLQSGKNLALNFMNVQNNIIYIDQ